MKSITSVCAALTCAWALTVVPLAAQGRGKGQGAATPIVHAQPHSAATASAHASAPASKSASASRTQAGPKPKPPKPAAPATAAAKGPKSNPHTSSQQAVKPMTVQQHLAKQPQLSAKLGNLLPGMNVSQAATGFKNLGAFVSAVHVSHNLGIPFLSLKSRLTGPNPQSLGQAIQALKPNAIVEKEVQRARAQSRVDLKDDSEKH